jgi:hypothetical protein
LSLALLVSGLEPKPAFTQTSLHNIIIKFGDHKAQSCKTQMLDLPAFRHHLGPLQTPPRYLCYVVDVVTEKAPKVRIMSALRSAPTARGNIQPATLRREGAAMEIAACRTADTRWPQPETHALMGTWLHYHSAAKRSGNSISRNGG